MALEGHSKSDARAAVSQALPIRLHIAQLQLSVYHSLEFAGTVRPAGRCCHGSDLRAGLALGERGRCVADFSFTGPIARGLSLVAIGRWPQ
jgi:hypothetical protein